MSASRSRLFASLLQFEKREIHTVFLRFPNFELSQKSRLGLLAKLRGAALRITVFLDETDEVVYCICKDQNARGERDW